MSTQIETEIERHVLTQSKILSDGIPEKIFTRNPRSEFSQSFTYNCHLCSVANLPGERALQTHITGKKHQSRLMVNYVPDALQFRAPLVSKSRDFPGEPAPPGQEENFILVSQLEAICNKQTKAIIGLEYVVELIDNKAKEPFYICSLCDKRCDPRNIVPQVTSHRHRLKYLELHFQKVYKVLSRHVKFNEDMVYREEILSKVCDGIEKRFGKLKPHICEYREYEKNKQEIHHQLTLKRHFDQSDWPNCDQELLKNIDTSNLSKHYEKWSSDEENDAQFNEREAVQTPSRQHVLNNKKRIVILKAAEKPKFLTHRELNELSNARMQEKYLLEKFKVSVEIAVKELDKKLKEYEKSPEKHPQYSDEWKAFWSRRYKELLAQGKNANDYDYKPEWIEFWMKRMKELHKKEVAKIKTANRKKLGLGPEVEDIVASPKPGPSRLSRSRSPKQRKRSLSPIPISDDSDTEVSRKPHKHSRFDSRKSPERSRKSSERSRKSPERPRSRFTDESSYSHHSERRSRDSYYSKQRRDAERKSPEIIDDGPICLVSVCRHLSALESDLGLLAQDVINLLTKAVSVEKTKPNSADELLYESENFNLLETVREKLKGVLSTNLLESNKISAFKLGIQKIARLLHEFSSRLPPTKILKSKPSEDKTNDQLAAAKQEIANAITQALIEEGRTNVTAEELEMMIESFIESDDKNNQEEEVEDEKPPILEVRSEPKPEPQSSKPSERPKISESNDKGPCLENLNDDELKILLRNFTELTRYEQTHLITYLTNIEQTDPVRVENLKKYVDLAEDMEIEEEVRPTKSEFKKSPEPIKQDLSDDEYNDDAIVKDLGMKGLLATSSHSGENSKSKVSTGNAFQDKSGLADSLMSSLMQSSNPIPTSSWSGDLGGNIDMNSQFYQNSEINQYQNLMGGGHMSTHNMHNMNLGPPQMVMPFNQSAPWPQNSATNFYQEVEIPNEYANGPNRKRFDNHGNNRHLKGNNRQRR